MSRLNDRSDDRWITVLYTGHSKKTALLETLKKHIPFVNPNRPEPFFTNKKPGGVDSTPPV